MSLILRVRRKRSHDPTPDLAVAFKRPRIPEAGSADFPASAIPSAAQRFRLASTVEESEEETLIGLKKIIASDSQPPNSDDGPRNSTASAHLKPASKECARHASEHNNNESSSSAAKCLRLADVDLSNPESGSLTKRDNSSGVSVDAHRSFLLDDLMDIEENGPENEALVSEPQGEWVYDLYMSMTSVPQAAVDEDSLMSGIEVSAWNEELVYDKGEEGEEEENIEDDEDSNDEDNWRNDYPDEEEGHWKSGGSDSDNDDFRDQF